MNVDDRELIGPFVPLGEEEIEASLAAAMTARPEGPVHVFGYGSLLWRPCFVPDASVWVRLPGFERRFSIWTVEARGTPERPGLGLSLEKGAHCDGVVFTLARASEADDLRALWAREMYTGVYRPAWVIIPELEVPVLTFVADPSHPQHAGEMNLERQAHFVATAVGKLGSCKDYLDSTVEALGAVGIRDSNLVNLQTEVHRLGSAPGGPRTSPGST